MSATHPNWSSIDPHGLRLALTEARKGYDEGGIPIGSALIVSDDTQNNGYKILGSGYNERIQKSSPILHAEMAALEDAGRLKGEVYRSATIYTTLSPCSMCTGAILLYKIPRVVIGENSTFVGGEALLRAHGVDVVVIDDEECKELMGKFIAEKPEEWDEDIGEVKKTRNGSAGPSES